MPTSNLNLPTIDNTKTADIVRDMNALAEAVDAAAGTNGGLATLDPDGKVPSSQLSISAPVDATTSVKGIVMLEDSTTSTSVTKAATPKSVKDAKDGLSTQIGILSGLNTTAKSNLVAAVNELFQFANDGKAKWSNVVGSPLASSDTFTQMQTKTQTIKDTLATNLTAKGQSSTGTETLTALVNKVSSVETGKKVAYGNGFLPYAQGATSASGSLSGLGLGFTPNLVFVQITGGVPLNFDPVAIVNATATYERSPVGLSQAVSTTDTTGNNRFVFSVTNASSNGLSLSLSTGRGFSNSGNLSVKYVAILI